MGNKSLIMQAIENTRYRKVKNRYTTPTGETIEEYAGEYGVEGSVLETDWPNEKKYIDVAITKNLLFTAKTIEDAEISEMLYEIAEELAEITDIQMKAYLNYTYMEETLYFSKKPLKNIIRNLEKLRQKQVDGDIQNIAENALSYAGYLSCRAITYIGLTRTKQLVGKLSELPEEYLSEQWQEQVCKLLMVRKKYLEMLPCNWFLPEILDALTEGIEQTTEDLVKLTQSKLQFDLKKHFEIEGEME